MRVGKRSSANMALFAAIAVVCVACKPRPTVLTEDVAATSGAALWAFATDDRLWSDSVEADRLCAAEVSACNKQGSTKKVRVRIWAHKAAKDVHDSAAGKYGTLVAKMENVGDAKERMYGLEPGNVYLLFLYRGDSTGGVYSLHEVRKDSSHAHREVQRGRQIRCNHPRAWQASWGTFSGCEHGVPEPPPYITASRGSSLVKTAYAASVQEHAESPPAWITCPSGCCTSGRTQTYQLTN